MRKTSNIDWVFWIQIQKREGFFKRFWKSRGSNGLDIQIYNWHISIGLPWLKEVVDKADANYPLEGINHFYKINESNRQGNKIHGRFRLITK